MADQSIEVDQHLYEILTNQGLEPAMRFAESRITQELVQKGTEITPQIQEYIVKTSMHEIKQLTTALRKHSLPADLVKLFEIGSKKEAKRFAENELVIKDEDFVNLIMNAQLFGFHHSRKHKEFVPDELKNFDPKNFGKADPETGQFTKEGKKAFTKITEIFKQRRQLNVHWFQSGFEWHCFFFDFKDLLGGHWAGGDHIHYLSHLWGLSSEEVWNGFDTRDFSPAKAHIKYIHNLRERQNQP